MKKTFILIFLVIFCSCSTEENSTHYNAKRLSFNIYDQDVETLLKVVANRYGLSLSFNANPKVDRYSLSVLNATVNDTLKKLSSGTGYYMKVIDRKIIVESRILDDSQTEISLKLNSNLWKDIRAASKDIPINNTTVKSFFGPLFSNVQITMLNSSNKTIKLYLPKEDVPFIKKSLLYLNYLEHRRNPVVTVFLIDKSKAEKFSKSLNSKEARFAWKINAGDNISFTDNDGNNIELNSQLLSQENNISGSEVFIKLIVNKDLVEHNFNFTKSAVQSVNFSENLTLLAKYEWYIEGKKISEEHLNSKALSTYKTDYSDRVTKFLNSSKPIKKGKHSVSEITKNFSTKDFNCRLVSLTSSQNSDIENFHITVKSGNYTLEALLKTVSTQNPVRYFVDEFGVLIDCQGTIPQSRNINWKILKDPLGASFYKFTKGSFSVNKENLNGPVVYLPSANAIAGFSNSNILKD